jgi:protein involved in polysaccharide export with SLBB domain
MNKLKIGAAFLVAFLYFLVVTPASAQTLPQNLSSLNVEDYSDGQIKEILQSARSQGLNDAQLIQYAQKQGMPAAQVQRLQQRILEIRSKDSGSTGSLDTTSQTNRKLSNPSADTVDQKQNPFSAMQLQIFGSSLFRNSKSNTFQPNLKLATPVNYIVGPDDKLQINVYGNSIANWNLQVSPEGNINIPGIGILNVGGKTIEQATAAIKSRLIASNYAIGRGTNVNVTLGDIRTISVRLQGAFVKPGTYSLPSLATAFDALYAAGGPSDVGSFRKIEIRRNNKIIRHLDLYDVLVRANQKDNISLQDQDIIFIPPYGIHVELKGEVKQPAIFETLPGEKLQDIIDYSGGFTDQAYTARVKVVQASDRQLRIADIFEKDYKNYTPLRGDKFTVDRILDRYENRVTITGAVFRPGEFELANGLTLSKLIKNAGGLKEDAFTGRASILRLNPDNTTQQLSFSLQDVMTNPSADITLQREDNITVSSVFDLHDKYKVTIKGEVRKPGDFDYSDSLKVADLIIKAGGFAEGASARRIEVSRRVFNSDPTVKNTAVAEVFNVNVSADLKFEGDNFTLKPFDIVSVYSLPGYESQKMVKIEGEVIFPGNYTIEKKNEKISDLIRRAGGLTQSADVEGGSLKRDNDAVLGVDKNKIDTEALNKERTERLMRLQQAYNKAAAAGADTSQFRNNFVGIDLKKILEHPGIGNDLILENGDVLRVPKQQQTVRVNGEVLYPSAVVYSSGKSFRGYVLNAGGFSPNALKRGAYVVYPNGTVKGTTKILFFNNHPRVKPGSEIYVPKKPEPKGNTTQEILGYTTGLASLGAIILGILSLKK